MYQGVVVVTVFVAGGSTVKVAEAVVPLLSVTEIIYVPGTKVMLVVVISDSVNTP
jgi:hypothetical protein